MRNNSASGTSQSAYPFQPLSSLPAGVHGAGRIRAMASAVSLRGDCSAAELRGPCDTRRAWHLSLGHLSKRRTSQELAARSDQRRRNVRVCADHAAWEALKGDDVAAVSTIVAKRQAPRNGWPGHVGHGPVAGRKRPRCRRRTVLRGRYRRAGSSQNLPATFERCARAEGFHPARTPPCTTRSGGRRQLLHIRNRR